MAHKRESPAHPPHPANCAGDFYVEDDCCITCGVPLDEAPDVFAWAEGPEYTSCIVARQPQTPEAVDRTLAAMWASEVDCVRYLGKDPEIARRIAEMGCADLCDLAPPRDAVPLVRSHVSFRTAQRVMLDDARQIAQLFSQYFKQDHGRFGSQRNAKTLSGSGRRAAIRISWFKRDYHTVAFNLLDDGSWLAITKPKAKRMGIGLSRIVDGWLRSDGRFNDIRWFTAEQWRRGGPYRATVI